MSVWKEGKKDIEKEEKKEKNGINEEKKEKKEGEKEIKKDGLKHERRERGNKESMGYMKFEVKGGNKWRKWNKVSKKGCKK